MTTRRLPHTPAAPSLTGGEDRPAPACAGKSEAFDVLVDLTSGPAFKAALIEARTLCGTCPLMTTCLRSNTDERWARAVLGIKHPPTSRKSCGKARGQVDHANHGEESCERCKAFMRERWHNRKRPSAEITHGTDTGYSRHRKAGEEACEPCKEAHRIAERLRAAKKRESAA